MAKRPQGPRRRPLPREPVDAVIDGFTHGGEGVARVEGKAVFVPGTLPGERVRLAVEDDRARWARARLVEVVEPSPDRVVPPCPYVPDCGGCDLQHATPEAQRALKTRVITEQLTRLGGVEEPPVAACLPVGPDTGYRTHARFHAATDGRLGFHRAGSNDVVPIDRCLVLGPATQGVRDAVGDSTGAQEVAVRAHASSGAAAAVFTPGAGGLALPEGPFDVLLTQPDGASVVLRGDGVMIEEVAGFRFRFDADSFFQVSTPGAEALVETVLDAAGDVDGALTWDLYAGVGLLSLPLAAAGAEVVAVEVDAGAAGHLETNAEAAGVEVTVIAGDVASVLHRARTGPSALEPPDVVVLDPPRSGARAGVVADLAALAPAAIVYVACDVAALARDTRELALAGYQLRHAQPLDLFPMTHHVEVVARFTPGTAAV